MLSDEEKKAIEWIKCQKGIYYKTIVDLIEKQDKMINEMAEMLVKDHEWFYSEFDNYTVEDFIEYFSKKVGE